MATGWEFQQQTEQFFLTIGILEIHSFTVEMLGLFPQTDVRKKLNAATQLLLLEEKRVEMESTVQHFHRSNSMIHPKTLEVSSKLAIQL